MRRSNNPVLPQHLRPRIAPTSIHATDPNHFALLSECGAATLIIQSINAAPYLLFLPRDISQRRGRPKHGAGQHGAHELSCAVSCYRMCTEARPKFRVRLEINDDFLECLVCWVIEDEAARVEERCDERFVRLCISPAPLYHAHFLNL